MLAAGTGMTILDTADEIGTLLRIHPRHVDRASQRRRGVHHNRGTCERVSSVRDH